MPSFNQLYSNIGDRTVNLKTFMAEMVGVFGFVLMGTGGAVFCNSDVYSPLGPRMVNEAIIGFGFGLGILFMLFATAHNGPGHLNPAVTIALIVGKGFPIIQGLVNIVAQTLGAFIAAGILKAMLPDEIRADSPLGSNSVPDEQTKGRAFLAEVVGTFIAMFVIFEACAHHRQMTGNNQAIAVGLTFGTLLTILSPISSGSFNPARSLGPASVSGETDDLWIWIFGPIVGALTAVPFHWFSVYGPDAIGAEKPMSPKGVKTAVV